MTTKLSLANLGSLPKSVARPRYDRASLKPGIVHFGVGNFHRSHQAVYLDDLFDAGEGDDGAIVGAGVFKAKSGPRKASSDGCEHRKSFRRVAHRGRHRSMSSHVYRLPHPHELTHK